MPKKKLSVSELRYAEYYGMQETFDDLYQRSMNNENFKNLMQTILSRNNILLAYRNIKTNTGSYTAGTDKLTIYHVGKLTADEVVANIRYFMTGSKHGYRPKPVRRKEIEKPNGGMRPLGIPCIWDRLIQQCIKQVLEPICEAKFSNNSYGFRPNRSVEHAMARTYTLLQRSNLHYVVEFDIKGFFDNVNHSKLMKQIWTLGIRDKQLLYIIKQILKAPIKLENGKIVNPTKGTPQGGIISPLLANIVLNELDKWVESQWEENPVIRSYGRQRIIGKTEVFDKSHGYRKMRKSNLKEMYIVRYADDFRIFCRTKEEACKIKIAITNWITERLKLEVSDEKTRIINTRKRYMEFLGFKIKVHKKNNKYVVMSHMCDKKLKTEIEKLVNQSKYITKPRPNSTQLKEVRLYNSMVLGIQNYYRLATNISVDCRDIQRRVMQVLTARLKTETGTILEKAGGTLTESEKIRFGNSKMIRFISGMEQPIYPIAYIKHKSPMAKKSSICSYTQTGRNGLHDNLEVNINLLEELRNEQLSENTIEFTDNRLSKFSAQWGKCYVTGENFTNLQDVVCYHKEIKEDNADKYANLVLISRKVIQLIQQAKREGLDTLLQDKKLNKKQKEKLLQLINR